MKKMIYLYDPINNTKQETDFELLIGITGKTKANLRSIMYKGFKVNNLNCYIINDKTTSKELSGLMQKEIIKNELWKSIEGSEGYFVSDYGRVKRQYKNSTRILMPTTSKKTKWQRVKIKYKDGFKTEVVHQLVAKYFVINDENKECIIHKNGLMHDNRAGNLAYVDRKYLGKTYGGEAKGKVTYKIDPKTNEIIDVYDTMIEASKENYLHVDSIWRATKGIYNLSGGWKWRSENAREARI